MLNNSVEQFTCTNRYSNQFLWCRLAGYHANCQSVRKQVHCTGSRTEYCLKLHT